MAANPLLACNFVTSSSRCEVAQLLSVIPFISVGILAFGVSTLFLVVRRVPLSVIFLFFSASLAFVAAALDLSEILTDELAIDATFVVNEHVIRAREVLFALSIGLRFLFYWSYIAEPSRRNLSATAIQRARKTEFPTSKHHSGSWIRWGLPGKLAAAALLVAIILLTTLQIVWRVVPRFRQYGNVYATDAALELLVSFLLLLKLLSNTTTLGSVDGTLVHTLGECLAPILGLLFNIAIGVGDLLRFAFAESMIGRLLQALEVYVIIVFVMITAFLTHRDISAAPSQGTRQGDVVFRLPEPVRGSIFRITPPLVETPRMSTIFGITTPNRETRREPLHRSVPRSLNHVSSWFSFRMPRHRSPQEDEEVKLWNAEKAQVGSTYTGAEDSTQGFKECHERDYDASADHTVTKSTLESQSVIVRSMEGPSNQGQTLHSSRLDVPQCVIPHQVRTSPVRFSPPSPPKPGVMHTGDMAPETSPVYGLGGVQSLTSPCDPRTSLDDLLRRQCQLNKSIETLRSFSADTSNAIQNRRSAQLTRSPSTGQKTVCSDVSLSNFPIPPWPAAPTSSLPPTSSSPIQRIRGDRRVLLAAARGQDAHALATLRTLASLADIPDSPRFSSIPHTPTGEENEPLSAEAEKSSHSDFGGMQYNVTSFIGDLATPGGSRQSQQKPWSVGNESDFGTSSDIRKPPQRQPEKLPGVTKPSPPSRLSQGNVFDKNIKLVEKDMSRSPTRPQLTRDSRSTEGGGRVQKMFVRRRPARLAIQTYNPGIQPVQVLDDS